MAAVPGQELRSERRSEMLEGDLLQQRMSILQISSRVPNPTLARFDDPTGEGACCTEQPEGAIFPHVSHGNITTASSVPHVNLSETHATPFSPHQRVVGAKGLHVGSSGASSARTFGDKSWFSGGGGGNGGCWEESRGSNAVNSGYGNGESIVSPTQMTELFVKLELPSTSPDSATTNLSGNQQNILYGDAEMMIAESNEVEYDAELACLMAQSTLRPTQSAAFSYIS